MDNHIRIVNMKIETVRLLPTLALISDAFSVKIYDSVVYMTIVYLYDEVYS